MINFEGDSEGLLSDRKVFGEAMCAHASQSCCLSHPLSLLPGVLESWVLGRSGIPGHPLCSRGCPAACGGSPQLCVASSLGQPFFFISFYLIPAASLVMVPDCLSCLITDIR